MWRRLQEWKESPRAGPDVLTVYVSLFALLALAIPLRGLPWYMPVLAALCWVGSITLLWLTHLSDPGVIPPRTEKDATVSLLEAGLPVQDAGGSDYRRDARGVWLRRVEVPGWRGPLLSKYCDTCHIWRPPRAHHCEECGACIARFDHHCGVVGNCIGGANHRFFAGFLVVAQIGCAIMAGGAVWRLQKRGFPGGDAVVDGEAWVILFLAVLGGYHVVVLLFGTMHCCSAVLNITTKDLLRDSRLCANPPCCPGGRSPFQLAHTLWAACCTPVRLKGSSSSGSGRVHVSDDGGGSNSGGELGGRSDSGAGPNGWLLGDGGRGSEGDGVVGARPGVLGVGGVLQGV